MKDSNPTNPLTVLVICSFLGLAAFFMFAPATPSLVSDKKNFYERCAENEAVADALYTSELTVTKFTKDSNGYTVIANNGKLEVGFGYFPTHKRYDEGYSDSTELYISPLQRSFGSSFFLVNRGYLDKMADFMVKKLILSSENSYKDETN